MSRHYMPLFLSAAFTVSIFKKLILKRRILCDRLNNIFNFINYRKIIIYFFFDAKKILKTFVYLLRIIRNKDLLGFKKN